MAVVTKGAVDGAGKVSLPPARSNPKPPIMMMKLRKQHLLAKTNFVRRRSH
jgi:hypothetical protein